jgi:hypothetical protein
MQCRRLQQQPTTTPAIRMRIRIPTWRPRPRGPALSVPIVDCTRPHAQRADTSPDTNVPIHDTILLLLLSAQRDSELEQVAQLRAEAAFEEAVFDRFARSKKTTFAKQELARLQSVQRAGDTLSCARSGHCQTYIAMDGAVVVGRVDVTA